MPTTHTYIKPMPRIEMFNDNCKKDVKVVSLKRKRTCGLHESDMDNRKSKFNRLPRVDSFSSITATTERDDEPGCCSVLEAAVTEVSSHLASLPQELILKIVSYIGPSSESLVSISLLDRRFHRLMSRVGDAMLIRAETNFRILLPKLNPIESSLSLFLRHTFSHRRIQNQCQVLKNILKKDFVVGCCLGPIIVRSIRTDQSKPLSTISVDSSPSAAVSLEEIDSALDISLELMGLDVLSFFLEHRNVTIEDVDSNLILMDRQNIIQHCSESLEFQALSLAGQCGAKVFKYIKMQHVISGSWDLSNGSIKDTGDNCDRNRMDRARLLMQLVICRDLELARQDAELGCGRKRLAVGRSGIFVQQNLIESLAAIYLR